MVVSTDRIVSEESIVSFWIPNMLSVDKTNTWKKAASKVYIIQMPALCGLAINNF